MYNIPVLQPYRVTQGRGERPEYYKPRSPKGHPGIDYAGSSPGVKQEVYASKAGTVVQSHFVTGRGETIVIRHDDGMETIYAHLSSRLVKKGQKVKDMEYIGTTGKTGNSDGVHLHFGIRPNKSDPKYNRNNGYAGWIDPTDILGKDVLTEKEVINQIMSLNSKLRDITSDPEIRSVTNVSNIILRTK